MSQKVTVTAISMEKAISADINTESYLSKFEPDSIRKDLTVMSGKAAGICYMPDDYLSEGIQNEEKALIRAAGNAKSGHYSVYEHAHITFVIETNKAMAMILNSTGLYSISEKSARYTKMTGETELEKDMYNKWQGIFTKLITAYYDNKFTEKEITKLAMENARYFLSVFTDTVMEFTVPFGRAILLCGWLDDLADNIEICKHYDFVENAYKNYYKRVAEYSKELASLIRKAIGIKNKDDVILVDHKDIGIQFYETINTIRKLSNIGITYTSGEYNAPETLYGDNYTSIYKASFACLAQEERHRTLHYSLDFDNDSFTTPFIPKIIKGSLYEVEWLLDFRNLYKAGIVPQGTMVKVIERGRFEDFYLKCKERLCTRAQLEIMEITKKQVAEFLVAKNKGGIYLSDLNKECLYNMVTDNSLFATNPDSVVVKTRCGFKGYTCKERCKVVNEKANYYRNI